MSKKLSNFFGASTKKKFNPVLVSGSEQPDLVDKQRQEQDEAEEISAIKNSEWCTVDHEILTGEEQKEAEERQQALEKNSIAQPTRRQFSGWGAKEKERELEKQKEREREKEEKDAAESAAAAAPPARYKPPIKRQGLASKAEDFPVLGAEPQPTPTPTPVAKPAKVKASSSSSGGVESTKSGKEEASETDGQDAPAHAENDTSDTMREMTFEEVLASLKEIAEAYSAHKIEMNMQIAQSKYQTIQRPGEVNTG